ncbi:transcriptional regulator CodY [Streptococcus agalactiae COH1]|nr:transcriptional regulator CodY [Streptococcus agalactiae COH1]
MKYKTNTDRVEEFFETKQFPDYYVKSASRVYDTEANLSVDNDLSIFPVETKENFQDGITTIAPIYGGGMRLGTFIIWRNDKEFSDDDFKKGTESYSQSHAMINYILLICQKYLR